MSYYKDLTPYNYHHYSEKEFNVGWLQEGYEFDKGDVPEGFLEKLKKYSDHRMLQTKGWQSCHFCEENEHSSDEIRIVSNSGIYYACPMMIIHYVEAHNYLPPQEFIDAVMEGPEPGSEEYKKLIAIMPTFFERRKVDANDENHEEKLTKTLVEGISESISSQIMKELLEENPDMKNFIESYNKIMPSVHGLTKENDDSKKSE